MPCEWVSLFIGTPLGNLEGICLPELFERKGQYIWVPFLDPEDIKILSLSAIWNFGKGTGHSQADIRLWGTSGPSVRPGYIRTLRARTQRKSNSLSCQQQWRPKCLNPSTVTYYRFKSLFFSHVLLMLIVLFLLKQYEIVSQDQSQRGCSTYIQIHCECSCAFQKKVCK